MRIMRLTEGTKLYTAITGLACAYTHCNGLYTGLVLYVANYGMYRLRARGTSWLAISNIIFTTKLTLTISPRVGPRAVSKWVSVYVSK